MYFYKVEPYLLLSWQQSHALEVVILCVKKTIVVNRNISHFKKESYKPLPRRIPWYATHNSSSTVFVSSTPSKTQTRWRWTQQRWEFHHYQNNASSWNTGMKYCVGNSTNILCHITDTWRRVYWSHISLGLVWTISLINNQRKRTVDQSVRREPTMWYRNRSKRSRKRSWHRNIPVLVGVK